MNGSRKPGFLLAALMLFSLMLAWGPLSAHAAPPPAVRAHKACPTLAACQRALTRAYTGIEWERSVRRGELRRARTYGPGHALRLAAALYGISWADMLRHATCESKLNPRAKNPRSSARGLLQFLDGTWQREGIPGFSVLDPYANALAAARLVVKDGGWREWQCR